MDEDYDYRDEEYTNESNHEHWDIDDVIEEAKEQYQFLGADYRWWVVRYLIELKELKERSEDDGK